MRLQFAAHLLAAVRRLEAEQRHGAYSQACRGGRAVVGADTDFGTGAELADNGDHAFEDGLIAHVVAAEGHAADQDAWMVRHGRISGGNGSGGIATIKYYLIQTAPTGNRAGAFECRRLGGAFILYRRASALKNAVLKRCRATATQEVPAVAGTSQNRNTLFFGLMAMGDMPVPAA